MDLTTRSAGVLLHLTSLPDGDLGPEAYRFVDWLASAGIRWWQMLPVGPAGEGRSPYKAESAFAGDPRLISLEQLAEEGLLRRGETWRPKARALGIAFERFIARPPADFEPFRARPWVRDFVRYASSKGGRAPFHEFLQFEFDRQWRALRAHARRRGVGLIGDVPLYVAPDGADVRANPELFKRGVVAGVPPDYFSRTGQLWGNPVYRWDMLRARGFDWWIDRLRVDLERFDALRLDHFIGFHRVWEVPAGAKTAARGRFVPGPGVRFFETVLPVLGCSRRLIAEDLGLVTPQVRAMRDRFGFPGMRVLQFDLDDPGARRQVVYTGTHDNDTIVGWFRRQPEARRRELGGAAGVHWRMIERALAAKADVAIVPAQDVLGLGSRARMNVPGRSDGNWRWRLRRGALTAEIAGRLRDQARAAGRVPGRGRGN